MNSRRRWRDQATPEQQAADEAVVQKMKVAASNFQARAPKGIKVVFTSNGFRMLSDHPWFKIGEAIHFPCSYSRLVNYHEALEYVPTEKILAQAELEFASAATAMQAVGFAHELRALHMRNVGPTKEIVGTVKTFTCDESPFADTSVEVDGWRLRVVINTSGWSCTAEAIDGSETVKAEVISQVADPKNFVRHHGDGWATSEHRYTVTLKAQVPTRTYAQRMRSAGLAHLLQKSAMILVSNLN